MDKSVFKRQRTNNLSRFKLARTVLKCVVLVNIKVVIRRKCLCKPQYLKCFNRLVYEWILCPSLFCDSQQGASTKGGYGEGSRLFVSDMNWSDVRLRNVIGSYRNSELQPRPAFSVVAIDSDGFLNWFSNI